MTVVDSIIQAPPSAPISLRSATVVPLPRELELSILMPCLNEARTIADCIRKARQFLSSANISGEVLVADNGSTDGAIDIARTSGARVVAVPVRGYGAALQAGIESARGRYVIIGDADLSYDFAELQGFIGRLRAGDDLVMGNRFLGGIAPGAMPPLHRYLGNPVLSFIGRVLFKSPIGDFHCGMRGFSRDAVRALKLQATGMEFASEMVVKATLAGLTITEVPTTLDRDGRDRAPHLRTWRDGWRHLKFLLMMSPRWLLLYPGLTLMSLGLVMQATLAIGPVVVGSTGLDIHTMLYGASGFLLGLKLTLFALVARAIGSRIGVLGWTGPFDVFSKHFTLERGLATGALIFAAGFAAAIDSVGTWYGAGLGALDPTQAMRTAIPATTSMIAGAEIGFASFVLAMLGLGEQRAVDRRKNAP